MSQVNAGASNEDGRDSSVGDEFFITLDADKYAMEGRIFIAGFFKTYVRCGSQLAIWGQFPEEIQFTLHDPITGASYVSVSAPTSISYDPTTVADYAKEPCDRYVKKTFSVELARLFFELPPIKRGMSVEGNFLNVKSNTVEIPVK